MDSRVNFGCVSLNPSSQLLSSIEICFLLMNLCAVIAKTASKKTNFSNWQPRVTKLMLRVKHCSQDLQMKSINKSIIQLTRKAKCWLLAVCNAWWAILIDTMLLGCTRKAELACSIQIISKLTYHCYEVLLGGDMLLRSDPVVLTAYIWTSNPVKFEKSA